MTSLGHSTGYGIEDKYTNKGQLEYQALFSTGYPTISKTDSKEFAYKTLHPPGRV